MNFNKIKLKDGSIVVIYSDNIDEKTISYYQSSDAYFDPTVDACDECDYDFVEDWMGCKQ